MNRAERRRQKKLARSGGARPDAAMSQALAHLQAGRLERAERLLGTVLKAHPEHPDALHFEGVVMYQQGRYDEAITLLSAATTAAPGYAEAHNSLGIVFLEQRDLEAAVKRFARALEIRPDFAGAHANLGNAHQENGALDTAVAAYRQALTLDPRHREAAYRLASAHLARHDPEQALKACAICLDIDPHCQHALAYSAMALQALGRHDEAHDIYDYDRLIHRADIEPPPRYGGLDQFNDVLGEAVRAHPSLVWEPYNRVTRGGAVTGDILLRPTSTIKAFERVLRRAIDAYRESLVEERGHPHLGRVPTKYRLTLIASILRAGGRHPLTFMNPLGSAGCITWLCRRS